MHCPLEERKALLAERIGNCGRPLKSFDASFRTALDFLANPYELLLSDSLDAKRAAVRLTFGDSLSYTRGQGFRTAQASAQFELLGALGQKMKWCPEEDSNLHGLATAST